MKRVLPVAAGLLAALVQSVAVALGLGEMSLHSRLGERLDATIPLRADGSASSIKLSLAGGEDYRRAGVEPMLLALNFAVSRNSAGALQARITSRDPLRDPSLVLILEARDAHSRVLRQYRPFEQGPLAQNSSGAEPTLDEYLAASRAGAASAHGDARSTSADHPPRAAGTLVYLPPVTPVPVQAPVKAPVRAPDPGPNPGLSPGPDPVIAPTAVAAPDTEARVPPVPVPVPVSVTPAAALPPVAEQPAKPADRAHRTPERRAPDAPASGVPPPVAAADAPTINPQTVPPGWTPNGIVSPAELAKVQSAAIKAKPGAPQSVAAVAPAFSPSVRSASTPPRVIANPPRMQGSELTQSTAEHAGGGVRMTRTGRVYGPVARDETLWRVATKLRPDSGVSMDQMMLGLYRNNPQAFEGGIQKLGRGAMLKVPTREAFLAVEAAEATRQMDALLKRKPKASVTTKPTSVKVPSVAATPSGTPTAELADDREGASAAMPETETSRHGTEQIGQGRVGSAEQGAQQAAQQAAGPSAQNVAVADVPADDTVDAQRVKGSHSEQPGAGDEATPAAGTSAAASSPNPDAAPEPDADLPLADVAGSTDMSDADAVPDASAGADNPPASSAPPGSALDEAGNWIRSLQDDAAKAPPRVQLDPVLVERLMKWKLQIGGGLIALLLAVMFLFRARRRQRLQRRHTQSFRDQRPIVVRSSATRVPSAPPSPPRATPPPSTAPLRPSPAPGADTPPVIESEQAKRQAEASPEPQRSVLASGDADLRASRAVPPSAPARVDLHAKVREERPTPSAAATAGITAQRSDDLSDAKAIERSAEKSSGKLSENLSSSADDPSAGADGAGTDIGFSAVTPAASTAPQSAADQADGGAGAGRDDLPQSRPLPPHAADELRFELDDLPVDAAPPPAAAVGRSPASVIADDDDVIAFTLPDEKPLAVYSLPVESPEKDSPSPEGVADPAQQAFNEHADAWIVPDDFEQGLELDFQPAASRNPGADKAPAGSLQAEPTELNLDDIDLNLGDFDSGDLARVDRQPDVGSRPSQTEPGLVPDLVPDHELASPATPLGVSEAVGAAEDEDAAIKLDLAQAYVEMGDRELARALLDEILEQGGATQRDKARALLAQLST